ncbi:MAG TPA: carboxynorspermidine decarboxylase [Gammaproteobacteria bacterium]|nr:carboxynorspermidine decarboxylase [Gammaproteobacteria bacterium]
MTNREKVLETAAGREGRGIPLPATLETPAVIYDLAVLEKQLQHIRHLRAQSGLRVLYSVKACALAELLHRIAPSVDGFSASSLFEARLSREVLGSSGEVHVTSPGYAPTDFDALVRYADHINFNSLSQCERFAAEARGGVQRGLRINPQYSRVPDARYDPCRPDSKLGVPLAQCASAWARLMNGAHPPDGLHFHTHCESRDFTPLREIVERIEHTLPEALRQVRWLNLGGGYLLDDGADATVLTALVADLKDHYPKLTVYFEPGKALVNDAGSLVASVVDVFEQGDTQIAVLDTSVNHQPEVFEYQRTPRVLESSVAGAHEYLLAGGTCLAGDLFGRYRFAGPLRIGSRVTFHGVGAYALAKAHRFNGHNLPAIHLRLPTGELRSIKQYDYEDYHRQWC